MPGLQHAATQTTLTEIAGQALQAIEQPFLDTLVT
jgi:hypothetical protein